MGGRGSLIRISINTQLHRILCSAISNRLTLYGHVNLICNKTALLNCDIKYGMIRSKKALCREMEYLVIRTMIRIVQNKE